MRSGRSRLGVWAIGVACVAGGACQPAPPAGVGDAAPWVPPDVCSDRPAADAGFTCRQQAGWGKCREPWLRHCDETCGRCYLGAASCPAVVQGQPIEGRLRFGAPLTGFARTFELRHGNPNHPDRSLAFVGRDPESGRPVMRAEARTVYEVDWVILRLDLETGAIERTSQASGRHLGTTRVAYPTRGDAAGYRAELARLREVVARVQTGYWLPELGFEQPAVPELIGALCYLDALAASLP